MHPWNLTVDEAEILQESLAGDCVLEGDPDVETVAAIDVSMEPESKLGLASIVLYSCSSGSVVDEILLLGNLVFPYVPGLLAFREGPLMLQATMRLNRDPDCLLVNGHGYAHPRRFGLASHLGLLLDLPSIGCAKSVLVGEYDTPAEPPGSYTTLSDGEPVGYAFRSMAGANPIFLSPGHRISRTNLIPTINKLIDGTTRLPEPLHRAHGRAKSEQKRLRKLVNPFKREGVRVFLVGGTLRDLLAGRKPSDYDLMVTELPSTVRNQLAKQYGSSFFELDPKRDVYRMISREVQLDVVVVGEDKVVENLLKRDFTINSIGLEMNRESWMDPASGRKHIKQGIVQPTHEKSLIRDPLRLIRGFRFVAELEFEPGESLLEAVDEVAPRLESVSSERIVTELFKIVSLRESVACLQLMRQHSVFQLVPFFRHQGVREVRILRQWAPVLERSELFSGDYHGDYSLLTGLQVARMIDEEELDNWPLHQTIKKITYSSYSPLPATPEFSVLNESRLGLVGRILGRGLSEGWDSDYVGEIINRLQWYCRDRERLEREIVSEITGEVSDEARIGSKKTDHLRKELPGLWANRMAPVLES